MYMSFAKLALLNKSGISLSLSLSHTHTHPTHTHTTLKDSLHLLPFRLAVGVAHPVGREQTNSWDCCNIISFSPRPARTPSEYAL